MNIGKILTELRKSRGLSRQILADELEISIHTYIKYENESVKPPYETLCKLADFYHVSTDYLLGREPEKNPIAMLNLAVGEKEAIEKYVQLPEEVRQVIIDTMIQLSEAAKKGIESNRPVFTFSKYSRYKASAGSGYDLDNDDDWTELEVIDTPIARQADFAVEVDGRSMEPTYYDGDIVYIEVAKEIPVGQIGLFVQNGQGFIKEVGEEHLISHNDDYPDIYPDNGEIECIGRVIGVADLPEN